MKSSDQSDYLQPVELVKRWRNLISLGTLTNWRSNGTGPKYLKLGGRILYRRVDVEAWEAANHVSPEAKTTEKAKAPKRAAR